MKKEEQLKFLHNNSDIKTPPIIISVDVFKKNALKMIGDVQKNLRNQLFGALEIDYPWGIDFQTKEGKNFLNYETQNIQNLYNLEIEHLQDNGYLFMWTVAQKFLEAAAFMTHKGYKVVDTLVWIKEGVHSEYKNRMGYYFRHNKEICLLGLKGTPPENTKPFTASDIIKTVPGKNSQKAKRNQRYNINIDTWSLLL